MTRALGAILAGLLFVSCRQQVENAATVNTAHVEAPLGNVVLGNMALPAPADIFPALTGRVVDNANLLTPEQEATLTGRSEALERQTGAQLVIATVPSLGGRSIADYSNALGNHWRLGRAGYNDGALLVVAPHERQVRIALGNGILPAFGADQGQAIIDRDLVPAFRENRFFDGIDRGSQQIVARITARPARAATQ